MGRKGTNDTNKLASTYIVVKDSFKKIDDRVLDMRSCGAKIDQMDISSLDPQTAEKLTEMKEQLVSICDLTQQKLTLSADQLDRLIARVVEIDNSAQSKMSSTNEGIAGTKKGMLGGKR